MKKNIELSLKDLESDHNILKESYMSLKKYYVWATALAISTVISTVVLAISLDNTISDLNKSRKVVEYYKNIETYRIDLRELTLACDNLSIISKKPFQIYILFDSSIYCHYMDIHFTSVKEIEAAILHYKLGSAK